ncbi:hypothetical protein HPB47_006439, partial [Ixodes persulcatus]
MEACMAITLLAVRLIVLAVLLLVLDFGEVACISDLQGHMLGYIVILSGCVVVEGFISWVSMRGSILDTAPRASMQYLLYVRLGILLVEVSWLVVGVIWVSNHYDSCPMGLAKDAVLGIIVCNWCVLLSVLVTVWCTFDRAGRTWVKMKRYQRSLKDGKLRYKRSGSSHRNWRHRKAVREYQDSWNKRCRLLFCCMGTNDRNRNSFTEIAKLLSDFFRDLDVVPSDVVAGLVLLRKFQRQERLVIAHQNVCDAVMAITHYMHYALGVYGWPMFMMSHGGTGCCKLFPSLRCCCLPSRKKKRDRALVVEDNCCYCNYAALKNMVNNHNMEVVYVTYHVDVSRPFLQSLFLCDVLTDLNAEGEPLPTNPPHEDWLGHKDKGTTQYDLVLVGHSLGAGAAAILAILLKQDFPNLLCYAYAPPGGLLSLPAVEYTKTFITSVVLGKDVVPRIGLHQMEALRTDLINAIKRSEDPKWKIILGGVLCCCPDEVNFDRMEDLTSASRDVTSHPSDSTIALTAHQPLYPPGRIIHIVRNHPKERMMGKNEPVFQALWADNKDFDQVLISPVMIQDHMPDKLLYALEKLLVNTGPTKPTRKAAKPQPGVTQHDQGSRDALLTDSPPSRCSPPHGVVLETSFTDFLPPSEMERQQWDQSSTDLAYQMKALRLVPASREASEKNDDSFETSSASELPIKSDTVRPNWMSWAPLASPETYSDVSSISSKGSHHRNNGSETQPWAGIPVMNPLVAFRLEPPSLPQPEGTKDQDTSPDAGATQQVVTRATVEARPPWVHPDMHIAPPESRGPDVRPADLHLDFE